MSETRHIHPCIGPPSGGASVPRVARAFVKWAKPPAQRHPGIVRPHGRRGHCPRRGLPWWCRATYSTPRAPRYGDYLHFFEGWNALGEAGIPVYPDHGATTIRTPRGSTTSSRCRPTPPCCRATALASRWWSATANRFRLPDRRPRLLQPDVADGRSIAEGVTREAAEQALAVQHPHAAGSPFAVGLLHTGLNPRSGESSR